MIMSLRNMASDNVAQIITFGSMQAKAAVRDVGRAMGMSYPDVDRIAKLIPNEIGITIEQALNVEPQLREAAEIDKTAKQLLGDRPGFGRPEPSCVDPCGRGGDFRQALDRVCAVV